MLQGASKHTSFFYRQHPPQKMGKCITPNHIWLWFRIIYIRIPWQGRLSSVSPLQAKAVLASTSGRSIPDVLQPVKSSPQKGSQPTARSTTETSWQLCTWAKQKRGRRGSACSYPPTKLPSFRRQPFSKPLEPTGHGYLAKLHIKMSHGHSLNHFSKLGRRK